MVCKICNSPTINRRRTCSKECLAKSLALAGSKSVHKIRPFGSDHYLWKGGDENRKNKMAEYKRKYPEKHRAHYLVRVAKKSGKLKQLPCQICGEVKSEAHHEDYTKPLEVVWLCRKHHREADKKLGHGMKDFKKAS